LAIVVPFVEDCFAKTTFADSHGGRFLPYAASRIIHHSQGRDRSLVACNGGGTNTTPLTPAGGGSRNGQAAHTNGLTTFQSINAGGGAVSPFSADADYSGGQTASTTAAVNTNLVENAAPQRSIRQTAMGHFHTA